LFEKGLLKNPSDFYRLKYNDLLGLEKLFINEVDGKECWVSFREKTVENLLAAIEKSKEIPFDKVLFALGIRFVGENSAKKVAQYFGDIDRLMTAAKEELLQVNDVGERIAESILNFFSDAENSTLISNLKEIGLQFSLPEEQLLPPLSDHLQGMTFLVSGSFATPERRQELEQMIERYGGTRITSVSKKLSFIIAGENMGPAKLEKAQQFGIPIISEEEFLGMLSEQ
jgi:DNA ligase (NAD+)